MKKNDLWNMIKSGQGVETDFYSYSFTASSIAAAASAVSTISIQSNAAFVIVKSCYMASVANATLTDSTRVVPLINVAITDNGSGRNLQNTAVPINSIAGVGELPFVWPQQRILMPSSSVQCTFTNVSAATTYTTVTLTLFGYQVFIL